LVKNVGIIGMYDEGNGHPFSFSAIVNGYSRKGFKAANWSGILNYLESRDKKDFGFDGFQITYAWTQDKKITKKLCAACKIPYLVNNPGEMLGKIDALIVARDDMHAEIALPFLKNKIPVFIDKPLTLNKKELNDFIPYLKNGTLMSTSGLRYARELDKVKPKLSEILPVKLISATVVNELARYGIHMLDAIDSIGLLSVNKVKRLDTKYDSFQFQTDNGSTILLNCLGSVNRTFHLSIFGEKGHVHTDLHDNFSAFKRTLGYFFKMVKDKAPPIDPEKVIKTMDIIRKAKSLKPNHSIKL